MTDFSDAELERYSRQIILRPMGGTAQVRLKEARVLVIGAGGLGAPLLAYLAASGVGHITIADGDTVDVSNLQRQILFTASDVGRLKAEVAAERILALNPEIRCEVHPHFVNEDTLPGLMASHTLVADGSDTFATRLMVSDAAVAARVPLVSAAVIGFEGQIGTFAPHIKGVPCYRCFVPEHPGEAAELTCADLGVFGPAVGVMGSLQAAEVIRVLTGMDGQLTGAVTLFDMTSTSLRTMALKPDPACPSCASLQNG